MNFKNKYFPFLIVFFLFTLSCSKTDNDIPQDLELNNFIWKGLNAFYLWQEDINNLKDTRFNNQNELNTYLSGFPVPENLFESLLNRPTDRFSVIVDDYIALENSFQGLNLSSGMEFGLRQYENASNNVYGYVRYVIPNSSAASNNVMRGQVFNNVDGSQLTLDNYRSLLFGNNTNFTIGLADYNNGNPITTGTSISLSKTELQENPIAISKVIEDNNQKIGYLMYNQFAGNFDAQLNAVFAGFKTENIDNLIVDLRYNPGGFVSSATYLGGMITGQFEGELFSQQIWNSKVTQAWDAERFVNNFTNEIINSDRNGNIVLQENLNTLGLNKVYYIVTNSSASASELLINSLNSYIDVRVIGTTTTGKQEGSVTLYDSDNLSRTGANLNTNHTYAMQPIVFEISNKDGINYPGGIIPGSAAFPGVSLPEDYGNLGVLGERSDPLLNETLTYMATGAKASTKNNNNLFKEVFNSKLANPAKDNMIIQLK